KGSRNIVRILGYPHHMPVTRIILLDIRLCKGSLADTAKPVDKDHPMLPVQQFMQSYQVCFPADNVCRMDAGNLGIKLLGKPVLRWMDMYLIANPGISDILENPDNVFLFGHGKV